MHKMILMMLLVLPIEALAAEYYTTFAVDENPISEGGVWLNGKDVGLKWSNIRTMDGKAIGTDNFEKYSDPTSILDGVWGPNQTVEATVYRKYNGVANDGQELELRLRSTMRADWCSGYEVFFRAYDKPYIQGNYGKMSRLTILKWKGPRGTSVDDFKPFLFHRHDPKYAVVDGDRIKASIVSNVISVWKNDVLLVSIRDNQPFPAGNPGFGFNYNTNKTYPEYGFHDFKATSD